MLLILSVLTAPSSKHQRLTKGEETLCNLPKSLASRYSYFIQAWKDGTKEVLRLLFRGLRGKKVHRYCEVWHEIMWSAWVLRDLRSINGIRYWGQSEVLQIVRALEGYLAVFQSTRSMRIQRTLHSHAYPNPLPRHIVALSTRLAVS